MGGAFYPMHEVVDAGAEGLEQAGPAFAYDSGAYFIAQPGGHEDGGPGPAEAVGMFTFEQQQGSAKTFDQRAPSARGIASHVAHVGENRFGQMLQYFGHGLTCVVLVLQAQRGE
ncbi:hypothetical protein ALQ16_202905 [Pseudomonas syringae pv. actinidiae]|nr:hypothetical protein ALQ16_202905 [Pseudomonas syringae pv. actinidiae]